MFPRQLFYGLLLLLTSSSAAFAQGNKYAGSRNFLGITGGNIIGAKARLYIHPRVAIDMKAGRFLETQTLCSNYAILANIPVGRFENNQVYGGLGYWNSSAAGFAALNVQLGYRLHLTGPLFMNTTWSPWVEFDGTVNPLAGALSLSYAFLGEGAAKNLSRKAYRNSINGYYSIAFGIKTGLTNGISLRAFTSPRTAMNLDLDYSIFGESYNFNTVFTYSFPISESGLSTYLGIGGGYHLFNQQPDVGSMDWYVGGHLCGTLGFEYNFFDWPISLGIQWEPRMADYFGLNLLEGGVLLRYTFQ